MAVPDLKTQYRKSILDEELRVFDPRVHAMTMIEEEHRMIHDGFLSYVSINLPAIPNLGISDGLIVTGAIPPHVKRLQVAASLGPISVDFFEDTVVGVQGTPVPVINANRLTSNVSLVTAFANPTVTTPGTSLGTLLIPGGSIFEGVIGTTGVINELLIKPNSNYLIRLTNNSGATIEGNATLVWYEPNYPEDATDLNSS